jgi:hypothetical protein
MYIEPFGAFFQFWYYVPRRIWQPRVGLPAVPKMESFSAYKNKFFTAKFLMHPVGYFFLTVEEDFRPGLPDFIWHIKPKWKKHIPI